MDDLSRVLEGIAAEQWLTIGAEYLTEPGARPRICIASHQHDPGREPTEVTIWLPVYEWRSVNQSVPLAKSSIVSCLIAAARDLGIAGDELAARAQALGIEVSAAIRARCSWPNLSFFAT